MKVLKIAAKNLKLLLRSKTSLLVVIFGPLLIMLLVGFAFNNPAASKLNIGYYSPEKTNLTSSFIGALESNPSFSLGEYKDEASCIDMIEQGKVHLCIVFPENFKIENNKTNEIIFYVDQSRANFVYAVIDTVSSKIDFTSNQLSYQLTNDLIGAIDKAKKANNDNIMRVIRIKTSLNDVSTKLESIHSKLGSIDLSKSELTGSTSSASLTNIKNDIEDLKDLGDELYDAGDQFLNDDDATSSKPNATNQFDAALDTYDSNSTFLRNKTNTDLAALSTLVSSMSSDVDKLNKKLDSAKSSTTDSAQKITELQATLTSVKADLDSLKASIESTNAAFNSIKVTSAESIVNPIQTTIKPINTKSNNLNFIFPYVIVLIIVFISIMLSSTTIIVEKTSKAYFRNFTTPTSDFTFIASIFLTSIFVVLLQLALILGLAYYFLNTTILSNIGLTLLLILAAITFFTLLGMILGYMFNSQEGVMMASISVGSVLLFLSNLILPLETMSTYIQEAARYNPYVVCSELLKKITLFGSSWDTVAMDFILIGAYIAVALVLVIIVQKASKMQYLNKKPLTKIAKKDEIIDKYFKLKSGVLLRNEKDLLEELSKMSDETYAEYVDKKKNDFESWLSINNRAELAKKVSGSRARKEMVEILEKEIKKK